MKNLAPFIVDVTQIEHNQMKIILYQYKASGFTGLFAGQFNTEDHSAFTNVI